MVQFHNYRLSRLLFFCLSHVVVVVVLFLFHFFFGEFFSVVFLLCDAVVYQNSSSFSMPQNQEKKQIPRYEVRFTNKNHPFMWLVCKTRAKILLSDPETPLTTPRLLPLRRSRRSYGNYQSPQSSGSSRNILKRVGRSGRSYGNQA